MDISCSSSTYTLLSIRRDLNSDYAITIVLFRNVTISSLNLYKRIIQYYHSMVDN